MTRLILRTKRGGKVVKPEGAPGRSESYQGLRGDPTVREIMFRRLVEQHTSDLPLIEEMMRNWREGKITVSNQGKIRWKR